MRLVLFFGFLIGLALSTSIPNEDDHTRSKRQLSIDDIIHKALSLVRPIFDTSQPIQNDAMINHQFNDPGGSEGMRQQDILGARPTSILDGIPLCKGNSRICQFISCQAENFKKDQNFANLNLAAQVLGDKKLRKAVSSNPDAINAVCSEQGMSDDQCKLFSKGFQLVDNFITTVEGGDPQLAPPLPEEEKLEPPTRKTRPTTTTAVPEPSAFIQQDDDLVLTAFGPTSREPTRTVPPPLGPPKLPLQDDVPRQSQRVRIEMGPGQLDERHLDSSDPYDSFGRQPRKILGSKTWSSQPVSNSIEPDPVRFDPIVPQSPFGSLPSAISPPFGPPGHFLFPTIPPSPPLAFSLPTFPTLPPLPTLPTLPPPLMPVLSIQPLKAPGLTLEKPMIQFSKDSYAEVFRQGKDMYRKRREADDDYDFYDIPLTSLRVKRDYYQESSQARRNLGLGGGPRRISSEEPTDPDVILGEKGGSDDYYTQTEAESPKKSKKPVSKGRDCLALLG